MFSEFAVWVCLCGTELKELTKDLSLKIITNYEILIVVFNPILPPVSVCGSVVALIISVHLCSMIMMVMSLAHHTLISPTNAQYLSWVVCVVNSPPLSVTQYVRYLDINIFYYFLFIDVVLIGVVLCVAYRELLLLCLWFSFFI